MLIGVTWMLQHTGCVEIACYNFNDFICFAKTFQWKEFQVEIQSKTKLEKYPQPFKMM